MLKLTIKKMLKNPWITTCLFLGCFLMISIMSSIPIYSSGIFNKLLVKDLQSYQMDNDIYPGVLSTESVFTSEKDEDESQKYNLFLQTSSKIDKLLDKSNLNNLNLMHDIRTIQTTAVAVFPENSNTVSGKDALTSAVKFISSTGIEDEIELVNGIMYKPGIDSDGCYEVIVSEYANRYYGICVGTTYSLKQKIRISENVPLQKIKVVGIYKMKDDTSSFWWNQFTDYEQGLLTDFDTLKNDILKENSGLTRKYTTAFVYDYQKLTTSKINILKNETNIISQNIDSNITECSLAASSVFSSYSSRKTQLSVLILMLEIPLIAILMFFIYMVAKLIISYDENEIAVLKSRGATKIQIVKIYLYECGFIIVIACITGIPFGILLSSIIGSANGFLEFVNRSKLTYEFNLEIILFVLAAIVLFISATIIPVIIASRNNVVSNKQSRLGNQKTPLWEKACVDLILVVASLYGLFLFYDKQKAIVSTSTNIDASSNPLLFLMASAFMLGVGLLSLRLYPYIIRFIHFIGRKHWPANIHVSMTNMFKNKSAGKMIVLFLTFTISVGIYNAATARTLTQNSEDVIRYRNGADIKLKAEWTPSSYNVVSAVEGTGFKSELPVYAIAPEFDVYRKLDGVEEATKVYVNKTAKVTARSQIITDVNLMSVIPDEFAKIAWFRNDLMKYPLEGYLAVLAENPEGCLLSKTLADKYNLSPGDNITMSFTREGSLESNTMTFSILAFVDYFPTYNQFSDNIDESNVSSDLIVTNYDYMFRCTPMDRYEVWIKRADGATSQQIYDSISESGIKLASITDTTQEVIQDIKNNSTIQGINGSLSLAFSFALIITGVGYLIYWIVDVKRRALQFSILRSIGISKSSLYVMIIFEQLIVALYSIVVGTIIGGLTSSLFIKAYGLFLDPKTQVPPFKIIIYLSDYIEIFGFVAAVIAICLYVIISIVKKLNITATLKLGED